MVSKSLLGVWAFFDLALAAFGAGGVVVAILIKGTTDPLWKITFDPNHLLALQILGIMLLATFAISVGAIVQRAHVLRPLVVLNWMLVLDTIGVVIVGSLLWFVTLDERNNFKLRFLASPISLQAQIQDKLSCCGYTTLNDTTTIVNTSTVAFSGTTCPDMAAVIRANLTCVGPLTAFTDSTLNWTFTFTYAAMFAVLPLLLATLCVIKKREEDERFKRIDLKRGGRGFV